MKDGSRGIHYIVYFLSSIALLWVGGRMEELGVFGVGHGIALLKSQGYCVVAVRGRKFWINNEKQA